MSSIQYLIKEHAVTAAQIIAQQGKTHKLPENATGLTVQCTWDSGTSGTTAKCFVQTTLDGTSWIDIMSFAFTTSDAVNVLSVSEETAITTAVVPTDGTLAAGAVSGIIGSKVRAMVVTTGTYVGAQMDVHMRIENN